jgi:hypothetical protein
VLTQWLPAKIVLVMSRVSPFEPVSANACHDLYGYGIDLSYDTEDTFEVNGGVTPVSEPSQLAGLGLGA